MALIYYPPQILANAETGMPLVGLKGVAGTVIARGIPASSPEIYEDKAATAIIPAAGLTVTENTFVRGFYVDDAFGRVSFWGGGVEVPLTSEEGNAARIEELGDVATAAQSAAETAATEAAASRAAAEDAAEQAAAGSTLPAGGNTGQVLAKNSGTDRDTVWIDQAAGGPGGTATWGSLAGKPPTFPPDPHGHGLTEVSGLSSLGRSTATADTPQAFRALIGAGTGNGTSNLTLGTTAGTAAAGDRVYSAVATTFTPAGSITATNVQDAIVQAGATGGSGGTSSVYEWRYASGAYPTLPSTKPAGIVRVQAYGPAQPTTPPSWIGTGAAQALLFFDWAPLT